MDKLRNFQKKRKWHMEHWQIVNLGLIVYDVVAVNVAYFLALWLRFDCMFSAIPENYLHAFFCFAPVYTVFCILVFWRARLYNSIWRFASYSELLRTAATSIITFFFQVIGITVLLKRMPVSYYLVGAGLQFLAVLGIRFSYRFILLERSRREKNIEGGRTSRVMLIGAGTAGQMILRDTMKAKELEDRVFCIIDDNPNKWNRFVEGVPVVGGRDDILFNAEKYKIDKIFVAIPSASAEDKREILNICKETGCELRNLPGVYQLVNGEVTVGAMKDVQVEDLLGREAIRANMDEIFQFLRGKTILVTGGGGSIGSELCRQIAGHSPKQLIIFDVYENNAYDIEQELKEKYPQLNLVVLIGSVRDSRKINSVFETYKPDVVYHAAAHKHVPLMETSPCEAIKNNAIGTYKTAYAAMTHGCRRFVLISTDTLGAVVGYWIVGKTEFRIKIKCQQISVVLVTLLVAVSLPFGYQAIHHQHMVKLAAFHDSEDGTKSLLVLNGKNGYAWDTDLHIKYLSDGSVHIEGKSDKTLWWPIANIELEPGKYLFSGLSDAEKNTVGLVLETDNHRFAPDVDPDDEVIFELTQTTKLKTYVII